MTANVRDVRDGVRAHVRAETLVAVGVYGTCGHSPSCGRARDAGNVCPAMSSNIPSRTYACPHVPHFPHIATATALSDDSQPAHMPAHTARLFARAFLPAYGMSKEMKREGLAA